MIAAEQKGSRTKAVTILTEQAVGRLRAECRTLQSRQVSCPSASFAAGLVACNGEPAGHAAGEVAGRSSAP